VVTNSTSALNNQPTPVNVNNLSFTPGGATGQRAVHVLISSNLTASVSKVESFELLIQLKTASCQLTQSSVGDDTGIVFSITSAGQVQYTSPNEAGFTSNVFKWIATVTKV